MLDGTQQTASPGQMLQLLQAQSVVKRRRLSTDFSGVQPHPASGLKHSLHGNLYQLKLLMLFFWQGLQQGCEFKLATEMDAADKFDDLVIRYRASATEPYQYRFLQAKHKQDGTKLISWKNLTDEPGGEFDLMKYFRSYLFIRKQLADGKLEAGDIKDYLLCTNIALDTDITSYFDETNAVDPFFDLAVANAKRFRLKAQFAKRVDLNDKLIANTEIHIIAQLLVDCALSKDKSTISKRSEIVKQYQAALASILTKTTKDKAKLTANFINNTNLPVATQCLRALFLQKLNNQITVAALINTELKVTSSLFIEVQGEAEFPPEATAQDVDIFLGQLVIAVGQPNQAQLSTILEADIARALNLSEGMFWAAGLQHKMLMWMQEKAGTFLTKVHAEAFFKKMRAQLAVYMLMGPTWHFCKQLANSPIQFKHSIALDGFWQSQDRLRVLTTKHATNLVAVNLLSAVHDKYTDMDSKVILPIDTVLDMRKHVIDTLSIDTLKLIVVECNRPLTETEIDGLFEVVKAALSVADLKIIIVTANTLLVERLQKQQPAPTTLEIEQKATELTEESLTKLAQKPVLVGDIKTTIGDITDSFNATARAIFLSNESLSELVEAAVLQVPKHFSVAMSDFENSCYISRKLERPIEVDPEKLKPVSTDRFIVIGATVQAMQAIFGKEAVAEVEAVTDENRNEIRCIVVESQTQNALAKFKGHTVHILEVNGTELDWHRTVGSISNLRDYLKDTIVTEIEDYGNLSAPITLISAVPGMGKSTLLARRFQLIQDTHKVWHIRLKTHQQLLLDTAVNDINSLVALLSNMAGFESEFSRRYLHYCLLHTELIIQLDGFDEVDAASRPRIITLIKYLRKQAPNVKLIVTTRPELREVLENEFSILAYDLVPLERSDQIEYLVKYWASVHSANLEVSRTKLEAYATALCEVFSKSIADQNAEFLGIPLQANMLAEAFKESIFQFLNIDGEPTIPDNLDILALYKLFVEQKYVVFMHQRSSLPTEVLFVMPTVDALHNAHQLLAVKQFFPRAAQQFEFYCEPVSFTASQLLAAGVVTKQDGVIDFIHRTFSEYYIAMFLVSCMASPANHPKHQLAKQLVFDEIHKPRYQVINRFICLLVAEQQDHTLKSTWEDWQFCLCIKTDSTKNSVLRVYPEDVVVSETVPVQVAEQTLLEQVQAMIDTSKGDYESIKYEVDNKLDAIAKRATETLDLTILQSALDTLNNFIQSQWRLRFKAAALTAWIIIAKQCIIQLYRLQQQPSNELLTALQAFNHQTQKTTRSSLASGFAGDYNSELEAWKTLNVKLIPLIDPPQVVDPSSFLERLDFDVLTILCHCDNFILTDAQLVQLLAGYEANKDNPLYIKLITSLANRPLHVARIKALLIDKSALDIIDRVVKQAPAFYLAPSELAALYTGRWLTWLERSGIDWVHHLKILNLDMANSFCTVFDEETINGYHTGYANNLFTGLIEPLIKVVANRIQPQINTYAFLFIVKESLLFASQHKVTHSLDDNQFEQLLQIITRTLNQTLQSGLTLLASVDTLINLVKGINGQLLVNEQEVIICAVNNDKQWPLAITNVTTFSSVLHWRLENPKATANELPSDLLQTQPSHSSLLATTFHLQRADRSSATSASTTRRGSSFTI